VRVVFLTLDDVLALHADQIRRYGGSLGLRAVGLLDSALAAPAATFGGGYLHGGLHEMAAAYLFHVVKNHPFVDGNKRTGLVTMLAFLGLNGLRLEAGRDELIDLVLAVAGGRIGKAEIAVFVKDHTRPRQRTIRTRRGNKFEGSEPR
jgi:death-on-curing protein